MIEGGILSFLWNVLNMEINDIIIIEYINVIMIRVAKANTRLIE